MSSISDIKKEIDRANNHENAWNEEGENFLVAIMLRHKKMYDVF
jgi:hypothetical protein